MFSETHFIFMLFETKFVSMLFALRLFGNPLFHNVPCGKQERSVDILTFVCCALSSPTYPFAKSPQQAANEDGVI